MMGFWDKKTTPVESDLQSDIIEFAHVRGWFCEKIESRSSRGMTDLFCLRRGRLVMIEAKQEGEEARPQQAKRHRELRAQGAEVHVVDNMEDARRILR